jgi:hypothetical protein
LAIDAGKLKLVYTAHSSKTMDRSRDIAVFVLKKGYIPINPFLTLPDELLSILKFEINDRYLVDKKLLDTCNYLWVFKYPNMPITPGVDGEIKHWGNRNLIEYYNLALIPEV